MQKELVLDIEQGLGLTRRKSPAAKSCASVLWQRVRTFMETRDLLVLPTVAVPPFPVEQPYPTEINGKPLDNYIQWFSLTYGITVTGLPAISVPCGFTRSGLPVGLQIVGRRRQEAAVLRAAAAFEAAAPWAGAPASGGQLYSRQGVTAPEPSSTRQVDLRNSGARWMLTGPGGQHSAALRTPAFVHSKSKRQVRRDTEVGSVEPERRTRSPTSASPKTIFRSG